MEIAVSPRLMLLLLKEIANKSETVRRKTQKNTHSH